MLISFFRYLGGYVRIRLTGYSPERFLNLCKAHQMEIWDLQNCGTAYEMCLSVRDFRRLRPLRRKSRAHVLIIERHGLPFFLHRYRHRKMFPIGILLAAVLLYFLSLYIWNIHIEGNYSRTTDVILDYLESEQIVHGMKKSKVDCKKIQSMIRIQFPDIIWVSAQIRGTRLMIRVKENMDSVSTELKAQEEEPRDIVAKREGLITSILVRRGVAQVKVGDEVEEGALLVSGKIDLLDDSGEVAGHQYTAADADIYARTSYRYSHEFVLAHPVRRPTGRKQFGFYLRVGGKTLTLDFEPNYETYSVLNTETPFRLTENFYLPLAFGTIRYEEYENCIENYRKEEAKALALEHLEEFKKNLLEKGLQIVENNVKIEVGSNVCTAYGTIETLEELSAFRPRESAEEVLPPAEER